MSLEAEYFGDELGYISFFQLPNLEFNAACSSRSKGEDNTGHRLYAGAHVAIRYFLHYRGLFSDELYSKVSDNFNSSDSFTMVELGCGTGLAGLLTYMLCPKLRRLVLTDGNIETIALTERNLSQVLSNEKIQNLRDNHDICCTWLQWSLSRESAKTFLNETNDGKPFKFVIGCELMYYLTDIPALLTTVLNLTNHKGIFLHSHLFRRYGQEIEIVEFLRRHDWSTYLIPIETFIAEKELSLHPEWHSMKSLISGPKDLLQSLKEQKYSEWLEFDGSVSEEGNSYSAEDAFVNLSNIEI